MISKWVELLDYNENTRENTSKQLAKINRDIKVYLTFEKFANEMDKEVLTAISKICNQLLKKRKK